MEINYSVTCSVVFETAAIVEYYNCSVLVEIEKNKLFLILESELDADKRRRVHVLFF